MGLSVAVAVTVFQVPFRGSFGALILLSSIFMLASLGFGLLISAAIRIQFVAAQISIVAGYLPALFLSGLLFDLESTPPFIQIISHVVPARYFVAISHTLFMAGDIWSVLLPNALVLTLWRFFSSRWRFAKSPKRLEDNACPAPHPGPDPKRVQMILKDPKSRFVIIGPPLIQFFIFGYAATYDLKNVRYAIYDEARSTESREFFRGCRARRIST